MDFKKQYFSQWGEAWNFHQKWYDNDGKDKTWDQIIKEAGTLMRDQSF